jgi:exopolysaccharide biosynthesis polyprenyl glycosylphosphotransferase
VQFAAQHQHESATQFISATRTAGRLDRGRTWILAAGDLAALAVAYAVCLALSARIGALAPVSAPAWFLALLGVLAVPTWLALFTAYKLYGRDSLRISVASFDEVGDVFHALLTGSLVLLIVDQGLRHLAGWWVYSAVEAAIFLAGALVLIPLLRGSLRSWLFPRVMRPRRAIVVGTGPEAARVERKLASHPEYGLEVVGVFGERGDLARVVDELEVERVILASPVGNHEETLDLLRDVRRPYVFVSIVPSYSEIFASNATLDELEGMPVVSLPPLRLARSSRLLKRSFDVVVSSVALCLVAPLLGVVAVAIRLDSSGPSLFRQPRRGRAGSTFEIVKFRTMHVGAEGKRHDADVMQLNEVDGPLFKVKGRDPRVTRVGGFLRRTSIDELPQLWNVVRGDMSLVGPRPFVIYEADQITGWAAKRLDMTPGITGMWQVLGRNDMPYEEMCKLDYLYVTNWSLWWDFKILCQTIPVVVGRRGAY